MIFVWRALLFVVIVGVVCAVVTFHIPLNGKKDIQYGFDGQTGSVSFVYPVSRVKDRQRADEGSSFIQMVEDPLYVDVTTRVPYDTATIEVTFANTTPLPFQMGIKQKEGSQKSILLKGFEQTFREGHWTRGSVSFDLQTANYYNGKYTFVFSVPGLVTEKNIPGEIRLSEMTLHLQRKPFSLHDLFF